MREQKRKKTKHMLAFTPTGALFQLSGCSHLATLNDHSVWVRLDKADVVLYEHAGLGKVHASASLNEQLQQCLGALGTEPRQDLVVELSLTEAVLLVSVIKSLQLRQGQDKIHAEALWSLCCHHNPDFVWDYVAYQHLKAKGYIVKPGLQYGTSFVLYSAHLSHVHSDFCVLLLRGTPSGSWTPDLSWNDLEITHRLVNQVSKRLALLWVYEQTSYLPHTDLGCLSQFRVEERLFERWVPEARVQK